MFTGIVEALGKVKGFKAKTIGIECPVKISKSLKLGSSLSVNGVCLTVVKKNGKDVFFNLVSETVKRTNLANLKPGDFVNLERALEWRGRIEGHLVLGHVDGVGRVRQIAQKAGEKSFLIQYPPRLKKFLIEKGSVSVDGVSLTLGKVTPKGFWVHIIPHTLKTANLKFYREKTKVNLEADTLLKTALTSPRRHYKL